MKHTFIRYRLCAFCIAVLMLFSIALVSDEVANKSADGTSRYVPVTTADSPGAFCGLANAMSVPKNEILYSGHSTEAMDKQDGACSSENVDLFFVTTIFLLFIKYFTQNKDLCVRRRYKLLI